MDSYIPQRETKPVPGCDVTLGQPPHPYPYTRPTGVATRKVHENLIFDLLRDTRNVAAVTPVTSRRSWDYVNDATDIRENFISHGSQSSLLPICRQNGNAGAVENPAARWVHHGGSRGFEISENSAFQPVWPSKILGRSQQQLELDSDEVDFVYKTILLPEVAKWKEARGHSTEESSGSHKGQNSSLTSGLSNEVCDPSALERLRRKPITTRKATPHFSKIVEGNVQTSHLFAAGQRSTTPIDQSPDFRPFSAQNDKINRSPFPEAEQSLHCRTLTRGRMPESRSKSTSNLKVSVAGEIRRPKALCQLRTRSLCDWENLSDVSGHEVPLSVLYSACVPTRSAASKHADSSSVKPKYHTTVPCRCNECGQEKVYLQQGNPGTDGHNLTLSSGFCSFCASAHTTGATESPVSLDYSLNSSLTNTGNEISSSDSTLRGSSDSVDTSSASSPSLHVPAGRLSLDDTLTHGDDNAKDDRDSSRETADGSIKLDNDNTKEIPQPPAPPCTRDVSDSSGSSSDSSQGSSRRHVLPLQRPRATEIYYTSSSSTGNDTDEVVKQALDVSDSSIEDILNNSASKVYLNASRSRLYTSAESFSDYFEDDYIIDDSKLKQTGDAANIHPGTHASTDVDSVATALMPTDEAEPSLGSVRAMSDVEDGDGSEKTRPVRSPRSERHLKTFLDENDFSEILMPRQHIHTGRLVMIGRGKNYHD